MSVPAIVIDGTQAYGTVAVTPTPPGVSFSIEQFKINRGDTKAGDFTTSGAPNRVRSTNQVFTWTGVLQLPSAATAYPQHGSTFSNTFDSNYGAETFVFDPVDYSQSNSAGEIRKIDVKGWIALNPGQITTAN